MKRVFTKCLLMGLTNTHGAENLHDAVARWTTQEDIVIIGCQGAIHYRKISENDGYGYAMAELSQVGVHTQDGGFFRIETAIGWNTTPAGYRHHLGEGCVMFPEGYGIPIKEEGTVYLNMVHDTTEETAETDIRVSAYIFIFYVKGARKVT